MQALPQKDDRYFVGINILVVPDGVSQGRDGRLRLSLSVTPDVLAANRPFDIRNWPEVVAGLSQRIRVAVGRITDPSAASPITEARVRARVAGDVTGRFTPSPTTVWQNIFKGSSTNDEPFLHLIRELKAGVTPSQEAPVMDAGVTRAVGTYPAADMAVFFNALYASTIADALGTRLMSPVAREGAAAPAPVPSGDRSLSWWRDDSPSWLPSLEPNDPVGRAASQVAEAARTRASVRQEMIAAAVAPAQEAGAAAQAASRTSDAAARDVEGMDRAARHFRSSVMSETARTESAVDLASAQLSVLRAHEKFVVVRGVGARRQVAGAGSDQRLREQADDEEKKQAEEDRQAAPRRKFSAILSYPTLAKYLGLIVDVEIAMTDLLGGLPGADGARVRGAVAAEFVNATDVDPTGPLAADAITRLDWTAFVYRRELTRTVDSKGETIVAYFGPCSRDEYEKGDGLFKDGLLDLGLPRPNADRLSPEMKHRFHLETVDVSLTALSVMQRRSEIAESDRLGRVPAEQVTKLPDVPTRGIALFDRLPPDPTKNRSVTVRVSYAEQLTLGYRYDVAIVGKDGRPSTDRWRSLMCRDLKFGTRYIDSSFAKQHQIAAREDSHVRTPQGETRYRDKGGELHVESKHEQLWRWTGESFGPPSLHGDGSTVNQNPRKVKPNPDLDLAIDLTINLPAEDDEARHPPPLRDGMSIVVGGRAYLVNGCGLRLDEAVPLYVRPLTDRSMVMGRLPGVPFPFERRGEIPAPDVCLLPHDPIVTTKSLPDLHGDTSDTLIVRDGGATAQRILIPPRSSFDLCEQAGAFDKSPYREMNQPPGAFVGAITLEMDPDSGALPIATEGTVVPSKLPAPDAEPTPRLSRGSVAVLGKPAATDRKHEFYPDPHGRSVCARLVVDGKPSPFFSDVDAPVPFWERAKHLSDAEPVLLELVPSARGAGAAIRAPQPGQPSPAGWFEKTRNAQSQLLKGSVTTSVGRTMLLPRLAVSLEPGEVVDLELWSMDDIDALQEKHWAVAEAMRVLRAPGIAGATQSRLESADLHTAICRAPMSQLNNARAVRLVHAVKQPLDEPVILSMVAVVITVRADRASTNVSTALPAQTKSWLKFVATHFGQTPATWPSEAGGSVTFFIGDVKLHRPSTGVVRIEAAWEEHGADRVFKDSTEKSANKWRYEPGKSLAQLFAFQDIGTNATHRDKPVSLLRGDVDEPTFPPQHHHLRNLSYSFPDARARELTLTAIATSRFTSFYGAAPAPDKFGQPGAYDKALTAKQTVWVPATVRPQPPDIDKVLPVFTWDEDRTNGSRDITFSREAALRVFLKHMTWPSSGKGEKLGMAFGPPVAAQPGQLLCEFEKRVGPFAPYVTRWGSDPIHLSGEIETLISQDRFTPLKKRELVKDKKLPLGPAPTISRVSYAGDDDAQLTELKAGTVVTIAGDNFIPNESTVRVNDQQFEANAVGVKPPTATVTLTRNTPLPLDVEVRNPELDVSVLAYTPDLDKTTGSFYVDIGLNPAPSYFPFVQLGLTRYQEHAAAQLHLSPPVTQWVQVPPKRDGSVHFIDDQHVLLTLKGIGYETNLTPDGQQREPADVPRLHVRLLCASTPGHVSSAKGGGIAWKKAVDERQIPIEYLDCRPTVRKKTVGSDAEKKQRETLLDVEWTVEVRLPRPRSEIRYALLIEEVEEIAKDPADPTISVNEHGELAVIVEDRDPMFWHVIDLGH
jgi:hypothetical protein